MDLYEYNLLKRINELNNAKTAMERTRRAALMKLLGQYRNEKKKNLE